VASGVHPIPAGVRFTRGSNPLKPNKASEFVCFSGILVTKKEFVSKKPKKNGMGYV
jgi:hypothetical protein